MAENYLRANPLKDFLLRKSNRPLKFSFGENEIVWAMTIYSIYEDQVAKAIMRVMVRMHNFCSLIQYVNVSAFLHPT